MLHAPPLDARGTDVSGTEIESHRTEFITYTIIRRKWLHVSQKYKERGQIEMDGNGGNNESGGNKCVLLDIES